jgi:hypothetical protein
MLYTRLDYRHLLPTYVAPLRNLTMLLVLSELSSVTSARLPKTRQVPDAGLVHPSGASVPRPIVKNARKERSQDRIRTCKSNILVFLQSPLLRPSTRRHKTLLSWYLSYSIMCISISVYQFRHLTMLLVFPSCQPNLLFNDVKGCQIVWVVRTGIEPAMAI